MKKPENPYRKSMFSSNNKVKKTTLTKTIEEREESNIDNDKIRKFKDSLKKTKYDSKTFSFYLETDLVKKVEQLAKETNNSSSTILNKILHQFFD